MAEYVINETDIFKYTVADQENIEPEIALRNAKYLMGRVPINIFYDEYAIIYDALYSASDNDWALSEQALYQIIINNRASILSDKRVQLAEDTKLENERFDLIVDMVISEYIDILDVELPDATFKGNIESFVQTWADRQMAETFYTCQDIQTRGMNIGRKFLQGTVDADYYYQKSRATIMSVLNGDQELLSESVNTQDQSAEDIKELHEKNELTNEPLALYGIDSLDRETGGVYKHELVTIQAGSGVGKAVTNSTIIPTPTGFKTVGEVKVGDMLFDRKGNPTKVLAVYPQGVKKTFRVTLSDGRHFDVNDEHLVPYYGGKKGTTLLNKELKYMLKDYIIPKNINGRATIKHKYKVPQNDAVEYPEQTHDISPYGLGILLGDGCLTRTDYLEISSNELDVVEKFAKECNLNEIVKSNNNYSWNFPKRAGVGASIVLETLQQLGLDVKSTQRFIPASYLYDSISNRKALLMGLMDTDGHIAIKSDRGNYHYQISTSSKILKDNILELVRSLGYGSSVHEDVREGYVNSNYVIRIFTSDIIVSSQKHLSRLKGKKYLSNKEKYSLITNIEEIGNDEMTCFTVDNAEHLFLINDYIVTHNTRAAIAIAKNIVNNGKNVLFISLEQKATRIFSMFQSRHILDTMGMYDITDKDIIRNSYPNVLVPIVEESRVDLVENTNMGRLMIEGRSLKAEELPVFLETIWEDFHFDCVVLDYLGLLDVKDRYNELTNAINYLKSACKSFKGVGFACIVPNQLSKEATNALNEGNDEKAKEGGSETMYILRASDVVITLKQDADMKRDNKMDWILSKLRLGSSLDKITTSADLGRCMFADIQLNEEEDDFWTS